MAMEVAYDFKPLHIKAQENALAAHDRVAKTQEEGPTPAKAHMAIWQARKADMDIDAEPD